MNSRGRSFAAMQSGAAAPLSRRGMARRFVINRRRLIRLGPLDAKMPNFAIGVGAACALRSVGAFLGLGCFSFFGLVVSPLSARRMEARLKGAVASAQRAARAFPLRIG